MVVTYILTNQTAAQGVSDSRRHFLGDFLFNEAQSCKTLDTPELPKHTKSLQDDIKHAVRDINTSMNWSNHKNVHCMQLCNVCRL